MYGRMIWDSVMAWGDRTRSVAATSPVTVLRRGSAPAISRPHSHIAKMAALPLRSENALNQKKSTVKKATPLRIT